MKLITYILLCIFSFCSLPLKSQFGQSLQNVKGEIGFGKFIVAPFKYTISSCAIEFHCGQNLFDSNQNTNWISDKKTGDEWIIIDFGSKRLLTSVEVQFSFYSETSYQVQVLNREVWTTILENPNKEKKSKLFFSGIDASTIRFYFPKNDETSISISSIKIFMGQKLLNGIEDKLTGYTIPVENGIIPFDDASLPGAPRKYRNGVHKGLDISYKENFFGLTTKVDSETKILSARDGEIIRIDKNYIPITEAEFKEISNYNQTHPVTFVDRDFGGRQIWIDHKNGVITTYNHLSALNPSLNLGQKVKKGEFIGYAGNSGLMGEAKSNNDSIHLHFEIWVDGEFFGKDLNATQTKNLLKYFFSN